MWFWRKDMEDWQSVRSPSWVRSTICTPAKCTRIGSVSWVGVGAQGILRSASYLHEECRKCHRILSVWSYHLQLQVLNHGNWRCWFGKQNRIADFRDAVCYLDATSCSFEYELPHTVDDMWAFSGIVVVTWWAVSSSWEQWVGENYVGQLGWLGVSDLEI